MTVNWKSLGRALEIITLVLLMLAVTYLWIIFNSTQTPAPQNSGSQSAGALEPVESPYVPPPQYSTDTGDYRQPDESYSSTTPTLSDDLSDPQFQSDPTAGTTFTEATCDTLGVTPYSDADWQQVPASYGTLIKIASAMPEGSHFMQELRVSAREIQARTEGRVQIKYCGGGSHGSASSVLKKI